MCRITVIKGSLCSHAGIDKKVDALQQYGSTLKQELFEENDIKIYLNRFPVTTTKFKSGEFPLSSRTLVLAFNGEVYSYQDQKFSFSAELSDAHFALKIIEEVGHERFFSEADFEGTFVVYERKTQKVFVYVDQLNTKGCFYSITPGSIIISQELSIVHNLAELNTENKDAAINLLKRGHCLSISYNNKAEITEYKPDFRAIWNGGSLDHPEIKASKLYDALKQSVADRLPKEGDFGMLCGGGVDSSLLFKIILDLLSERRELHRLKVFTLGTPLNPLRGEDNDLENAYYLMEYFNLIPSDIYKVIYPSESWNNFLLNEGVLPGKTGSPFLITPNPSQTQVRHVITMSCVLAQAVIKFPDIRVMITGDFADELFGGYNSMHNGNIGDLQQNIQHKLDDLPLNDASRVTLASLRGCKFLIEKLIEGALKTSGSLPVNNAWHPVEIRTPFASPLIAKVLSDFPASNLVGRRSANDKKIHSKYLLRLTAMKAGVPESIAWRKKIPFNEGGTGVRNTEPYVLEEQAAKNYFSHTPYIPRKEDQVKLQKLGLKSHISCEPMNSYEHALYVSAANAGLNRLMAGNGFRSIMPDSNYASSGNLDNLYN